MTGLEKIVQHLEQDAQDARCAIIQSGRDRAQALLDKAQAEDEAQRRLAQQRAETQGREHLRQLEGAARMEQRRAVLAQKQALLDEAFSRAAASIAAMDKGEYVSLLARLAVENGVGDESIILSPADREAVGAQVVDEANRRKSGAAFTLAEDTCPTGGGLVLRRGKVEIHCGFARRLAQLRQQEASALSALLFD